MKKKLIVSTSIAVVLITIITIISLLNEKPTMTGRAIVSASVILIVDEKDMPIQLNARNEKVLLNQIINTGDLIKITHDGYFLYSSPAQTVIDKIQVLEKGTIADVPDKAIEVLKLYNWPID